ncbi:MAG: DUF2064 domain-containing protein [Rhodanobacter sp.]
MTAALAIFVKTPGLSPVKTRLATGVGAQAALQFHQLAAAATAEVARCCEAWVTPYWAIAEAGPVAAARWPGFASLHQGESQLGERLHKVYVQLLLRQARVLLIGADAPQLTARLLRAALAVLDDPRTPFVIGDASDGGFWLFGGRQPVPRELWTGVRYSQPHTASDFRRMLAPLGAIGTVGCLTDVDRADDLPALRLALLAVADPLPAQQRLLEWLDVVVSSIPSMAGEP